MIFLLIFIALIKHALATTSNVDIVALYDLYNATSGSDWIWKAVGEQWIFSASSDPCNDNWQGVSCAGCLLDTACNVTGINLKSYNLSGTIPVSLCDLPGLSNITLSNNGLFSTIPSCIFESSEVHPSQITSFSVVDNQLSGEIDFPPLSSINLGILKLDLAGNLFNGSVPSALGHLSNMEYLSLANNSISGELPSSLTGCVSLEELDLGVNNITGSFPSNFWSAMQSLSVIKITDVSMSGPVASTICTIQTLSKVYLNSTGFTGSIPSCIFSMTSLEILTMDGNNFVGMLPSVVAMPSTSHLFLQSNKLSGTLPAAFGTMSSLQYFSVASNFLSGPIPSTFESASKLLVFCVSENRFSGTLPAGLFMLSTLLIAASDNSFTGSLPQQYSETIMGLILHANNFVGTIPAAVAAMTMLQQFDLHNNSLTGTLPAGFLGGARGLISMDVGTNGLTGGIDDVFTEDAASKFPLLQFISVQSNEFTGTIPASMLSLPSIGYISLSSNCFRGEFPNITGSETLEYLFMDALNSNINCRDFLNDLNSIMTTLGYTYQSSPFMLAKENRLDGTIPSNLFQANPNLNTFHFNGNGINGPLPEVANEVLSDLQVSNNLLSRSIPQSIQQSQIMTILDLSNNRFDGTITSMSAVYNIERADGAPNTLKLYRNRLSDWVPSRYRNVSNINILAGNSFECNLRKSDIPTNDGDYRNFSCDSDELWIAVGVMMFTVVVVVFVAGAVWSTNRHNNGSVEQPFEAYDGSLAELLQPIEFYAYAKQFCVQMTSFIFRVNDSSEKWRETESAAVTYDKEISTRHCPIVSKLTDPETSDYVSVGFFLSTMGDLQNYGVAIAFASLVYMVIFLILKNVNDGKYETHTDQYGWSISSLYLSGALPTFLLLSLWLLIVIATVIYGRYSRRNVDIDLHGVDSLNVHQKTTELFRMHPSSFGAYLFRFFQFLLVFSFLSFINHAYIVALSEIDTESEAKYLLVIAFVVLKFGFHKTLVDMYVLAGRDLYFFRRGQYCCTWLYNFWFEMEPPLIGTYTYEDRVKWVNSEALTVLQMATLIFSELVIPCVIVAVTNNQCFSYMFSDPKTTTSSITYNSCSDSALDLARSRSAVGSSYILDIICQSYGESPTKVVTETYELPFLYGKQCTSEILFAYIPVLMIGHFAACVMQPISVLLRQYLTYQYSRSVVIDSILRKLGEKEGGSYVPKEKSWADVAYDKFLPLAAMPLLWPINFLIIERKETFDERVDFTGARLLLFSTLRAIIVLLTFGLAFFPLAVIVVASMLINTAQFQYLVQHHFNTLRSVHNKATGMELKTIFKEKLSADCRGMWKVFGKYADVLLTFAGLFNSLYLYDTYSGNKLVALMPFLVPFCYTVGKIIWRVVHKKSYITISHYATKAVVLGVRASNSVRQSLSMSEGANRGLDGPVVDESSLPAEEGVSMSMNPMVSNMA